MQQDFSTLAQSALESQDNLTSRSIPLIQSFPKQQEPTQQELVSITPEKPALGSLDELLEESMEIRGRAFINPAKAKLRIFNSKRQESRPFSFHLVAGIEVWQQVHCECGCSTDVLFLRFMEKWEGRDANGKVVNWRTVKDLDDRFEAEDIQSTLIQRDVRFCAECTGLVTENLEDFNEVVK